MGWQTTVVIQTDFLDRLVEDPHIGRKLFNAIQAGHTGPIKDLYGVTLAGTSHSGDTAVYRVGGNTSKLIGHTNSCHSSDPEIVEHLARQNGLVVNRLPSAEEQTDSNSFEVEAMVEWTSQSAGTKTLKRGKIIAIIPAKQRPHSKVEAMAQGYAPMYDSMLPRDHTSYMVAVSSASSQAKPKLYWPRVSGLRTSNS